MRKESAQFTMTAPIWFAVIFFQLVAIFSANVLLTSAVVAAVPCFMILLWRKGEPPILLFAVMMQWLQAVTRVIHSDLLGIHVNSISDTPLISRAVWLSLEALIALALGARLGMSHMPAPPEGQILHEVEKYDLRKLWSLYLVLFVLGSFGTGVAFSFPQLTQIILTLLDLKWAVLFIFVLSVLYRRTHRHLLYLTLGMEIIFGITGFFGGFKEAFFVLFVALLTKNYNLKLKSITIFFMYLAVLFGLSVLWTSVKDDYRHYISGGERRQIVSVPFNERAKKMYELIGELNTSAFHEGVKDLAERIAQVDIFAYTLERVPSVLPYENGKLWGRAIRHILVPRLIYPNKPVLPSDTVLTNYYTGKDYAGEESGTSIAIGYVTESFIDFGPLGLVFPMFLLGALWGWMYRFFIVSSRIKMVGYALAVGVLMKTYKFEVDNVHLLGSVLSSFLITAIALKWLIPTFHSTIVKRS